MRPKRYAFKAFWKRALIFLFDQTGNALWKFLGLRRHLPADLSFKRILVIRTDALGDLLMTRPALAALHQAFPQAEIDLLIARESVSLMEDNREARRIFGMPQNWFSRTPQTKESKSEKKQLQKTLSNRAYCLAVDFRGDLRNIFYLKSLGIPHLIGYGITGGSFLLSACPPYDWNEHQVRVNLKLLETLGIQTLPKLYPLAYSAARKESFWKNAGALLQSGAKFRVSVHAGAGLRSKCWPGENFLKVIQKTLTLPGTEVVLIGTEKERELLQLPEGTLGVTDLRGKTELADLPVLLDACHLHLGNDSGPGHLAAAQGLAVISLFSGENLAEVWKPWGACPLEVLEFSKPEDITPEQVFGKIEKIYRSHHVR